MIRSVGGNSAAKVSCWLPQTLVYEGSDRLYLRPECPAIVTSFVRYKNQNAVPHYGGTNCGVGHRLDRNENGELTADTLGFLEMLRRTAAGEPDTDDLRIWADIDLRGTAEPLIRQIETPDLYLTHTRSPKTTIPSRHRRRADQRRLETKH